jgi:hypothetical protein
MPQDEIPSTQNTNMPPTTPPGRPLVSDYSFSWANVIAAGAACIYIPLLYAFTKDLSVEQDDIAALAGLVTAAGSIALAIPLFFKDVDKGTMFWKQFFALAFIFILAALLSFFCLLIMNQEMKADIRLQLLLFVLLAVAFQVQALPSWLRVFRVHFPLPRALNTLSIQVPLTFFFSLMTLVASATAGSGNRLIISFLLFTFYGLYLLTVITLSLIIQTFFAVPNSPQVSNRQRIKEEIELIADWHRAEPISHRELIFLLQTQSFPHNPEVINDAVVQELLREMNAETENAPKITILFGSDKIIPRWKPYYEYQLMQAKPKILILRKSPSHVSLASVVEQRDLLDALHQRLAKEAGITVQLVEQRNIVFHKYKAYKDVLYDYSSFDHIMIAVQGDMLHRLETLQASVNKTTILQVEELFNINGFCFPDNLKLHKVIYHFLDLENYLKETINQESIIRELQDGPISCFGMAETLQEKYFPEADTPLSNNLFENIVFRVDNLFQMLEKKYIVEAISFDGTNKIWQLKQV